MSNRELTPEQCERVLKLADRFEASFRRLDPVVAIEDALEVSWRENNELREEIRAWKHRLVSAQTTLETVRTLSDEALAAKKP